MVQDASSATPNGDVPPSSHEARILIIGAGITGLVLAQALKKHGIAFTIFERDPNVSARGRGWGLTIHWSLDTFISLLPQHLVDRLPETYVDPEASKRGENGNFLFFDLRSGETRWKVPPNKRIRVSRERLRALLLDGLDIQVLEIFLHFAAMFGYVNRLTMTIMLCTAVVPHPRYNLHTHSQFGHGSFHRCHFGYRRTAHWSRWIKIGRSFLSTITQSTTCNQQGPARATSGRQCHLSPRACT